MPTTIANPDPTRPPLWMSYEYPAPDEDPNYRIVVCLYDAERYVQLAVEGRDVGIHAYLASALGDAAERLKRIGGIREVGVMVRHGR